MLLKKSSISIVSIVDYTRIIVSVWLLVKVCDLIRRIIFNQC